MKYIEVQKGFTHAGKFHSDDVFSTALLQYLNPNIEIQRGNHVPEKYDGLIFDIGGGAFDHHQKDKRIRENGIPYAAFGLLWEKYGELILGEEEAVRFDEKFIQPLDFSDNTGEQNPLAGAIGNFNPVWDGTETTDDAFFRAVEVAQAILNNSFEHIFSIMRAKSLVEKSIAKSDGEILILEQSLPWKSTVKETDIKFVIFPSNRGGYCIQTVEYRDEETEEFTMRVPFPKRWRGMDEQELKNITGIEDARFCHSSGFLSTAETLEGAIKMAKAAIAE